MFCGHFGISETPSKKTETLQRIGNDTLYLEVGENTETFQRIGNNTLYLEVGENTESFQRIGNDTLYLEVTENPLKLFNTSFF